MSRNEKQQLLFMEEAHHEACDSSRYLVTKEAEKRSTACVSCFSAATKISQQLVLRGGLLSAADRFWTSTSASALALELDLMCRHK